jgi:hypothetical protein
MEKDSQKVSETQKDTHNQMISYDTNWMGPIDQGWYEERGIDTENGYWSGGRIDIYGLDEVEYYCGRHEYSLPIMDGESWNLLTAWLENFETETPWSFDDLIEQFQKETGREILWAHEEFNK